MSDDTKKFNPHEHIIHLKSWKGGQQVTTEYLPVQWRLVWFRLEHPHATIDTEEMCVELDRVVEADVTRWEKGKKIVEHKSASGYARYKATVTTEQGGRSQGTKTESAVNFADYCEKAETGAIGRALAAMGYGTQFTDQEFDEGERLADAPVPARERKVDMSIDRELHKLYTRCVKSFLVADGDELAFWSLISTGVGLPIHGSIDVDAQLLVAAQQYVTTQIATLSTR